jgi:hypothetical protein
MAADSDSKIAWHRARLRQNREALKRIETARFTVGAATDPKAVAQEEKQLADLQQKIRQSEQVIGLYERQTRRPLTTDLQSLSNVPWNHWNAHGNGPR